MISAWDNLWNSLLFLTQVLTIIHYTSHALVATVTSPTADIIKFLSFLLSPVFGGGSGG